MKAKATSRRVTRAITARCSAGERSAASIGALYLEFGNLGMWKCGNVEIWKCTEDRRCADSAYKFVPLDPHVRVSQQNVRHGWCSAAGHESAATARSNQGVCGAGGSSMPQPAE